MTEINEEAIENPEEQETGMLAVVLCRVDVIIQNGDEAIVVIKANT